MKSVAVCSAQLILVEWEIIDFQNTFAYSYSRNLKGIFKKTKQQNKNSFPHYKFNLDCDEE